MCGIIGIVTSELLGEGNDPRTVLAQLLAHPGDTAALAVLLDQVEQRVDELFDLSTTYRLMTDATWEAAARRLGGQLEALTGDWQARLEGTRSVEAREHLSGLLIRLKDVTWRLQEDLLPGLDRVRQLAGCQHPEPRLALELWKLDALLTGIDRLEVRGRDSAGLAIQITFSTSEALASLEARLHKLGLVDAYRRRLQRSHFVSGAIVVTGLVMTFSLKVAREIGELGTNVSMLRAAIAADAVLGAALAAPGVTVTPMAHTRWASNGIISEPNCHPLTNEALSVRSGLPLAKSQMVTAALNGDIDNFLELKGRLAKESDQGIPTEITTDAKIIPLWIGYHHREGVTFEEAFRRAVADFQGSMAIAVQNSDEPGRIYLALKGSGQSIFIGKTHGGFIYASELYGLVEHTNRFWKMDGEKSRVPGDTRTQGQIVVLEPPQGQRACGMRGMWFDGHPLSFGEPSRAEITTRDINRAGYPHFLLKEISEAVHSVRKTLSGKTRSTEMGPRFTFLEDIAPPELLNALDDGSIKRILCVGQGTAAIAAQGIATVMERLMRGSPVQVRSMKATELSGFHLRDRMDDTLVVAVSQSGTTTDTNRTVDMVKERGARVLAIVNRRNSDLVYKADAVFYTSDGRDVEMSVASTKAFYAQVTAGYLLALALADRAAILPAEVVQAELDGLQTLPDLIGRVVARPGPIQTLAEQLVVRHRHWAVVGGGTNFVAAQEIRIKLSELCYKAIPVDHTEDKKHIDLSSEPLILVCAAGLEPDLASDVAKEVAIFKAHKATPIVIATEGETRFDPYAAGVLYVPRATPGVAFVLATVVGHLWSYYAARTLDTQARLLRRLRAKCVEVIEPHVANASPMDQMVSKLRMAAVEEVGAVEHLLREGDLNSGLVASTAVRLSVVLRVLSGRLTVDDLYLDLGSAATASTETLGTLIVEVLTTAVDALTRPIDAIKHQAKTVTVGISRAEAPRGPLFDTIAALGIGTEQILPSHKLSLEALTPLVSRASGAVLYQVEALGPSGSPTPASTIRVAEKHGIARDMTSRLEAGGPLSGTKRDIIHGRRLFVGVGSFDGRPLILFPRFTGSQPSGVVLLHATFSADATVEQKVNALRHYRRRYDELVNTFAERNLPWSDDLLAAVESERLFEEPAAELIASAVRAQAAG